MGIGSPLIPLPSLTLGTADVTPIEMASAYSTLANDGKHCEPYAVAKVIDARRRPVPSTSRSASRSSHRRSPTWSPRCCRASSPAAPAPAALPAWPVAGKTGTTQDYTNAWFVGYTRQVSTAVWVGFPGTPDSLSLYFGGSVFGGTLAAPHLARLHAEGHGGDAGRELPGAARAPVGNGARRDRAAESEHAQNVLANANFTPLVEVVALRRTRRARSSHRPRQEFHRSSSDDWSRSRSAAAYARQGEVPDVVGMTPGRREDGSRGGRIRRRGHEQACRAIPTNVGLVLDQQPWAPSSCRAARPITGARR